MANAAIDKSAGKARSRIAVSASASLAEERSAGRGQFSGAELHHDVAFGKDFTHPTWVKIVCWAARKNSRVPSSPWVRPVTSAWFAKAGMHRLSRTAR